MEENNILKNDKASVNYRRNQNTLIVLGTGVMLFGFWGIIKLIAQILLGFQIFDPKDLEDLGPEGTIFVLFFVAIVLSIDVILRLYASLRARREGLGKKTGVGHLIVLVMLLISSVFTTSFVIWAIMTMNGEPDENFIALFLELTSFAITLEVFMASISVRRYRKKTAGEAK